MIPPKFIRVVGLHPLTPRWIKVLILQLLMAYVARKLGMSLREMRNKASEKAAK